jgi:endonuclease/exonuclease/phosphatase family metal-dependent hydrolase
VRRWSALGAALAFLIAGACTSSSSHRSTTPTSEASSTPPTASTPTRVLTLVTMNVLHGALCDDGAGHCDVTDRMALLAREIEAAGCPDVVALEEVAPWWRDLLVARSATLCAGVYHVVSPPVGVPYFDAETVLSKLTTSGAQRFDLADRAEQRRALRVELRTSRGPVILVVTHVGTGADDNGNGGASCARSRDCPPPCDQAGSAFACQIVQLRDIAASHTNDGRIATVIVGDMNLVPTATPLRALTHAGFVDTYRAAGRTECNRSTGAGCTSGRDDTQLAALRDPAARDSVRVDDIFLLPTERCRPSYGSATGLFAAKPAINGPAGLAWISDHAGVELDLGCR